MEFGFFSTKGSRPNLWGWFADDRWTDASHGKKIYPETCEENKKLDIGTNFCSNPQKEVWNMDHLFGTAIARNAPSGDDIGFTFQGSNGPIYKNGCGVKKVIDCLSFFSGVPFGRRSIGGQQKKEWKRVKRKLFFGAKKWWKNNGDRYVIAYCFWGKVFSRVTPNWRWNAWEILGSSFFYSHRNLASSPVSSMALFPVYTH